MTDSLNNVTIYLTDERLARADAVVRELSQRAGVKISRSAAIGRAIDELFLTLCLTDMPDDPSIRQPADAI